MSGVRILIAGIGNIFLGDDAFGVEVARRLSAQSIPEGIQVVDFGIRGFDLAYALLENYDAVILVDATAQGGEPGTVYTIEIASGGRKSEEPGPAEMETHDIDLVRVLEIVRALGEEPRRMFLVGCEPATLGDQEEGALGLSAPVERAVDVAIGVIKSLVGKIAGERLAGMLS